MKWRLVKLHLKLTFVPSHTDTVGYDYTLNIKHCVGNVVADVLANRGCSHNQINLIDAGRVMSYCKLVMLIQRRILCILKSLPRRHRPTRKRRCNNKQSDPHISKKHRIGIMISRSKRTIVLDDHNQYICINCSSTAHEGNLESLCLKECIPNASDVRPEPIAPGSITFSDVAVHASHNMYNYRGFMFCRACGHRGPSYWTGSHKVGTCLLYTSPSPRD